VRQTRYANPGTTDHHARSPSDVLDEHMRDHHSSGQTVVVATCKLNRLTHRDRHGRAGIRGNGSSADNSDDKHRQQRAHHHRLCSHARSRLQGQDSHARPTPGAQTLADDATVFAVSEAFTRLPLKVAAEWQSKTVTTDPPRYTPHEEWAVVFTLTADDPIRVAVFIEDAAEVAWGLVDKDGSGTVDLDLKFFPDDWSKSDDVQVSFEWHRRQVSDRALKEDPREVVKLVAPEEATTGVVLPLAELPSHGLTLSVLALAEIDTERRRKRRWRLKPALAEALPEHVEQLASGHQHGVARR
jgi:hypothetical protein